MATEREEIALANRIIEEFGIRTRADLPVDIDRILLANGFSVAERELPEGLVAVLDTTVKGKPLLVLDNRLSEKDARFTKARELGNYLLAKNFVGVRADKAISPGELMTPELSEDEGRARRFAAALLMPQNLLSESIRESAANVHADSHDDGDRNLLGILASVGTAFAVGAGVVLLASALSVSRKR